MRRPPPEGGIIVDADAKLEGRHLINLIDGQERLSSAVLRHLGPIRPAGVTAPLYPIT
jgi:hypothetical protein